MRALKIWLGSALILALPSAHAADLAFTNLSQSQVKSLIEEFSANFTHTSVSGASPLGSVFGLEIGVVAGMTPTSEIESLAKQADPSVDAGMLPHAAILAMVSVPFGFTFEGNFFPELGSDEFKFKNMGLAAKWSLTSSVLDLPFSLALRAHYMKTDLSFKQTVSSVTSTVGFSSKVTGLQLLVSKSLAILEPYIGIGTVSTDGEFDAAGVSNFFNFTTASSYSAKASSLQLLGGLEVNLLLLKVGLEASQQFGTERFSGKVAISF